MSHEYDNEEVVDASDVAKHLKHIINNTLLVDDLLREENIDSDGRVLEIGRPFLKIAIDVQILDFLI